MTNDHPLDRLPLALLDEHETSRMFLVARSDSREVLGTTTDDPASLCPVARTGELAALPGTNDAFGYLVLLRRLDAGLIAEALDKLTKAESTRKSLERLVDPTRPMCLVYVLAHANQGPLDDLTVFVGGDSYRHDVPTFHELFARTSHLAHVMLRKAVSLFPDIPALHGGKQGQWLLVDGEGRSVEAAEAAILALGSVAIPEAIRFANQHRARRADAAGVAVPYPDQNFIRPETASPDVLSAKYWPHLCDLWHRRGFDMSYCTCVPPQFCGPPTPAAEPTGYGLAVTTMLLSQRQFDRDPEGLRSLRFLVEALGSVSHYTIDALTRLYKIPPDNIVAIDIDPDACVRARSRFGVQTICARNGDFYRELGGDQRFDVWVNNGIGNDVGSDDVQRLLDSGVGLFCGAANNFLRVREQAASLERIFAAGAIAWPDEAASGGGYAMAVLDACLRAQRKKASTSEALEHNLTIIMQRNRDMLAEVVREVWDKSQPAERGRAIWQSIRDHIDSRAAEAQSRLLPDDERRDAADVRSWKLG